ncbi:MAG: hypothetical protein KAH25_02620 [Bacteroidales bacterium]|nr:hypothetical protein [Bacteroidales bacterium]
MEFTRNNILKGALIYSTGDTIASLLVGEFSWFRVLGIVIVGATIYAFEIPNYFVWIEKQTKKYSGLKLSIYKTALAILYFNPLWIARHLFFIMLFSGKFNDISWDILRISLVSFLVNIPISATANYLIQNKMPYRWRFMASAIFSALMAIYYALSMTLF